jgi:hypothetical protein
MTQAQKIRILTRLLLSLAALAAFTVFPALLPRAHAESEEQCKDRIVHANHKLHDAIDHHGPNSSQADHARHDLQEARERCWKEHHKWWDEDQQRWHDQQDWDEHDHH